MKISKSATTAAAPSPPKKAAGAKRKRRRQTGVRGKVLDLLAAGPHSSAELVAKGGFSAASLYLNLKALKREGIVATERKGRTVSIRLKAKGAAPVAGAATPVKSGAPVSTRAPRDLHQALEGLTRRLSPVERAEEKMLVLDQLSRSVPAPVASVLRDIINDVLRLAAAAA